MENRHGGWRVGRERRERASDGSLVGYTAREYRERVNLSAPHVVRRRFENREPRDYARRAARQNSAESAAIKAGASAALIIAS